MALKDRCLMTWEGSKSRWRKMYRGKMYFISCHALGSPPTKEASYLKANEWWRRKMAELEVGQAPPPHPHQAILDHLDRRIDWARKHGLDRIAENAEAGRYMVESAFDMATEDIRPFVEMNTGDIESWSEVFGDDIPEDRTIGGWGRRYVANFEARHEAGSLSAAELALTRRFVGDFVKWLGATNGPEIIDPALWEAWWRHLLSRVSKKDIGVVTARKHWAYARRLVLWMASMGAMNVPTNFNNKSYKIGNPTRAIDTLTEDEAKTLIRESPGQLKLHLLLMLNCGFTQVDIATLTHEEVDWKAGTITRQRVKTRQHHGKTVPTVTYRLWPMTFDLLSRYRSDHPALALTTQRGKPWVEETIVSDRAKSRDAIASNFKHVVVQWSSVA